MKQACVYILTIITSIYSLLGFHWLVNLFKSLFKD